MKIPKLKAKPKGLPIHPAKDTKKQREKRIDYLFYLIENYVTTRHACAAAGIAGKTFYTWLNNDPEMMSRYEEIKIQLHADVAELTRLCAIKAIDDPRYQTSAIFYLKSQAGWNDGTGFTTGAQEMPTVNFIKPPATKTQKVIK
jgi:hypothetical protein